MCVAESGGMWRAEREGWVAVLPDCELRLECHCLVVVNTLPSEHFARVM